MFIKGMDISTLLEEEVCGAKYYDNGVEQDLFAILKAYGTNSVRLRLWNDPYASDGILAGRAKKYQMVCSGQAVRNRSLTGSQSI